MDQRKKTCPDCRAVVIQQPTPSYLIRELVLLFVSRNELLPEGETTEEHLGFVREEAEAVAKDRANTDAWTGGLFKGSFKQGYHGYIGPIHDTVDGVDRCPTCHWELEEGYCAQCQAVIDPHGFSDYDDESDDTEDELDHELDLEDAAAVFGADGQDDYPDDDLSFVGRQADRGHRSAPLPWMGRRPRLLVSSDDEDESEADDEGEGNLTGFVVDDNDVEYESSEDDESTVVSLQGIASRPNAQRRAPVVVLSDDEEQTAASLDQTEDSDEDSEDEGPVAVGSQRHKRRGPAGRLQRGRRTVLSDDEESSTHDEEDHEDGESVVNNYGGFSPLESHADRDSVSYQSEYDTDGASTVNPWDTGDACHEHGYYDDDDDDDDDDEENDETDGSDAEAGWGPIYLQ